MFFLGTTQYSNFYKYYTQAYNANTIIYGHPNSTNFDFLFFLML